MKQEKDKIEYRYYEMPHGSPILALLGDNWWRTYGKEEDPLHFHNYLEIGYCRSGTGKLKFESSELSYSSRSFSIIPAHVIHNTIAVRNEKNRWEYLFVDVDAFINELYAADLPKAQNLISKINSNVYLFTHEQEEDMANTILEIMDLYRDRSPLFMDCAKGLLWSLLIRIVKLCPDHIETENPDDVKDQMITRALQYIWQHYPEKIQIADIAEICHLSETHFRRKFGQRMQIAPLKYIELIRIEAACRLLKSTQEPIQRIAEKCGFFSLPSFNRNFKELMGVTPLQWRKNTAYYEQKLEKQNVVVFNGWE